jgi:leader peptidase (prepilin peptidase) / N-methyltransferase
VTTQESAVIPHAHADPVDSLQHVAAERSQAPRRGLRLGWSLASAGVLLVSFAVAPGVEGALGGALGLLMLGISSVDARRFVVPNVLSAGAFALGVIHAAVASPDSGFEGALMALSRAAFAAGLFLLVRITYRRLRGRDGLGFGDVKLAGAAGAWLGLPMLPISIEIAAVTALAAYVLRQRKRLRILRAAGRVPFGAFFAPAIWLGWMLDTMIPTLN